MLSKSTFKNLIKECIVEVLLESPSIINKLSSGERNKIGLDGNSRFEKKEQGLRASKLHELIKECVLDVLMENLTECLDPLSQGPNIPEENPYPAWNAKMCALEEKNEDSNSDVNEKLGRYAQIASADEFDPRTFGPTTKIPQL